MLKWSGCVLWSFQDSDEQEEVQFVDMGDIIDSQQNDDDPKIRMQML